jgi:hypothetical protein
LFAPALGSSPILEPIGGSGVDNSRTRAGGQRADLVGDSYLEGDRNEGENIQKWLRKSAFQPDALGTFGNLGGNVFRGPGYSTVDAGLFKRFTISEQPAATLRFEAFNALNRTNLNGPNASLTSGCDLMRTTAAQALRILQLALRITW